MGCFSITNRLPEERRLQLGERLLASHRVSLWRWLPPSVQGDFVVEAVFGLRVCHGWLISFLGSVQAFFRYFIFSVDFWAPRFGAGIYFFLILTFTSLHSNSFYPAILPECSQWNLYNTVCVYIQSPSPCGQPCISTDLHMWLEVVIDDKK